MKSFQRCCIYFKQRSFLCKIMPSIVSILIILITTRINIICFPNMIIFQLCKTYLFYVKQAFKILGKITFCGSTLRGGEHTLYK